MERLHGVTMLDDLERRPWRVDRHADTWTEMHRRLRDVPVGDLADSGVTSRFGAPDAVLHLDFHPDNIMLTADGPVVFDWTNAALGPPAADVALAWLVAATSTADGSWWLRTAGAAAARPDRRPLRRRLRPGRRPSAAAGRRRVPPHRPQRPARGGRPRPRPGRPLLLTRVFAADRVPAAGMPRSRHSDRVRAGRATCRRRAAARRRGCRRRCPRPSCSSRTRTSSGRRGRRSPATHPSRPRSRPARSG